MSIILSMRIRGRTILSATHLTNPDVNWAGGTTFSPRSLRDTGAWNAAIIQAAAIHTFASAKALPGHTLGREVKISPPKLWKCSLPSPKAENKVLRVCLRSISVQESIRVELVGVWIHLFVTGHRPTPRRCKELNEGSMDILLTRRSGLLPCWQEYHTPYTGHRSSIDEAQLHDWMSE
jgi:hypothetical protein